MSRVPLYWKTVWLKPKTVRRGGLFLNAWIAAQLPVGTLSA